MPSVEFERAVHVLTMARMRLSATGRWEGPPSPKVRGFNPTLAAAHGRWKPALVAIKREGEPPTGGGINLCLCR
jgi:hypothetical protein